MYTQNGHGSLLMEVINTEESWPARMNTTVYGVQNNMQYDRLVPVSEEPTASICRVDG